MEPNENLSWPFPEGDQIHQLLEELMPTDNRPLSRPNGSAGNGSVTLLGACAVGTFLPAVNWKNAPNYQSPVQPRPTAMLPGAKANAEKVIGALSLRTFLNAVNWSNTEKPRPLDVHAPAVPDSARLVVETFMNEIEWD